MSFQGVLDSVNTYYTGRVAEHGPTPRGVDWNSHESQHNRFNQLLKVCDFWTPFTLLDYGCGYGALLEYLTSQAPEFKYIGFDLSARMISEARAMHGHSAKRSFTTDESTLKPADYTVASGIFNVKLQTPVAEWEAYVHHTLDRLASLSKNGFAFNVLTSYSDREKMRPDLYYADPLKLFDHCKTKYSKQVALLHDYGLYEFTILVRK